MTLAEARSNEANSVDPAARSPEAGRLNGAAKILSNLTGGCAALTSGEFGSKARHFEFFSLQPQAATAAQ